MTILVLEGLEKIADYCKEFAFIGFVEYNYNISLSSNKLYELMEGLYVLDAI